MTKVKNIGKKTLYLIVKITAYLFVLGVIFYSAFIAVSFLTRWTPNHPTDSISNLCFIAVDSEEQFVPFKKLIRQKNKINQTHQINQIISTQQTVSKKDELAHWELTTEKGTRTVYYADGDYFSWFRYRLNNQVTPLSCRIIGPATGIGGGFLGILILLLLELLKGIYRWRKQRKSD